MKATLTFNLDDPDDKLSHFRCVKSLDMALALLEIQSYARTLSELEQVPCGDTIMRKVLDIFDDYAVYPHELSN